MSNRPPLEGQVAKILNERELAINIGSALGVVMSMKFAVLADAPDVIVDPRTNQQLGVVDRPKVRVQATEVNELFSICETYRTRTVGGGLLAGTDLFSPPRQVRETLRADESSRPKPLSPEESYVKIGDRVKEIVERR